MRFEFRELTLPLSDPLKTAAGTIDERTVFLVRIDRDGVVGIGEAAPLQGWTESVAECEAALGEAAESLPADPHGAMAAVAETPAARHGIRLAATDREARADEEPLYRYLGGTRECATVPVNATIGDGDVDETVTSAERAVADGFETLKLKLGARSLEADLERVRRVREAVGDDVVIRGDANGGWDRDRAERAFRRLREYDVSYVEQPLPAEDLAGLRALRGEGVGVAVDETLREVDVATVVAEDAADAVVLKPMVAGGPERVADDARLVIANGIDPVVTTTIDGAVARTGAVHCAATIPSVFACGLATGDLLAEDVGPDPAAVEDGAIRVPQSSGVAPESAIEAWWSA
jgi:o-succinylbenzoate synthase